MDLLGDNTRNIYKDNYDRNRFLDKNIDIYSENTSVVEEKKLTNRELGNMLYNTIVTKYNIKNQDLTPHQLDELILKYDLVNNTDKILDFVKELKEIIKTNYNQIQNISDPVYNNNLYDSDIKSTSREFYICIDSNDRNMVKWEKANNYQIVFGNTPTILGSIDNTKNGEISRSFNNIDEIELVDIIYQEESENGDQLPYILLQIDELGPYLYGSNKNMSNSFAKIVNQTSNGNNNYKYKKLNLKKKFSPPIDINTLTFYFKKPNGELVNMIENSITLKMIMNNK